MAAKVMTSSGRAVIYADLFSVRCWRITSVAFFLRSKNEKHPHGLANSSGQVGRNYMGHNNGALIVISKNPNYSRFQKAFAITDFYHGGDHGEFPLGAIQLMGRTDYDSMSGL